MSRQIRRWPKLSLYDVSLQIRNDHLVGRQLLVGNPAWLDGHPPTLPVNSARIAEGIEDEPPPHQFEVRFQYFLA